MDDLPMLEKARAEIEKVIEHVSRAVKTEDLKVKLNEMNEQSEYASVKVQAYPLLIVVLAAYRRFLANS